MPKIYYHGVDLDELQSVADLFRVLAPRQQHGMGFCFRGHRDWSWPLTPTLFRLKPFLDAAYSWEYAEQVTLRTFFREAVPFVDSGTFVDTHFHRSMLAQHYGAPTRLLDWTLNPLVALYFAVFELTAPETDGAFIVLDPPGLIPTSALIDMREADRRFNYHLLVPPAFDARLIAQRGVFSWHLLPPALDDFIPHDPAVPRPRGAGPVTEPNLHKFRIRKEHKAAIKLQLESFFIDHARLFPGLDGIGAMVKWSMERSAYVDPVFHAWRPT